MPKRVGGICRDGTITYATGRGAGSHHGGVQQWLYEGGENSSSSSNISYSGGGFSSYGFTSHSPDYGYTNTKKKQDMISFKKPQNKQISLIKQESSQSSSKIISPIVKILNEPEKETARKKQLKKRHQISSSQNFQQRIMDLIEFYEQENSKKQNKLKHIQELSKRQKQTHLNQIKNLQNALNTEIYNRTLTQQEYKKQIHTLKHLNQGLEAKNKIYLSQKEALIISQKHEKDKHLKDIQAKNEQIKLKKNELQAFRKDAMNNLKNLKKGLQIKFLQFKAKNENKVKSLQNKLKNVNKTVNTLFKKSKDQKLKKEFNPQKQKQVNQTIQLLKSKIKNDQIKIQNIIQSDKVFQSKNQELNKKIQNLNNQNQRLRHLIKDLQNQKKTQPQKSDMFRKQLLQIKGFATDIRESISHNLAMVKSCKKL